MKKYSTLTTFTGLAPVCFFEISKDHFEKHVGVGVRHLLKFGTVATHILASYVDSIVAMTMANLKSNSMSAKVIGSFNPGLCLR